MSSTNSTSHYELSQFVGSDKPAWLGDYNSDMAKIDAGVYQAQSTATGADGKADTNATAIGTLANLTTSEKGSLVGAVNEVNTAVGTAQNTANTATQGVEDLSTYFNINTFTQISTPTTSNGSITTHGIYVARNSAGTLGKVYGFVGLNNLNANSVTVTLPNTGFATDKDINIQGLGIFQGDQTKSIFNLTTVIKSNGNVELTFTRPANDSAGFVRAFACLLFIKNFGDQPE